VGSEKRFFAATVLGGRLHVAGIPEWGPWEASRLHWWPEDHLDLLTTTRERKVRTTEELEAAVKEPMTVAPTRNVWIHESLEDEGAARKPIHPVGESPTRGVAQLAAVVLSGV
jgi:hypothetical protein